MAFNKKTRLLANIESIRTAFALDMENRMATEAERPFCVNTAVLEE